ncbi:MAG: AsmA family protein [Alcanivorax sp.]
MKRLLVILFTVVFVCLAALVFAPSFIDWSAYKDQAAQQVAERTGLTVDIKGGLGFAVVPSPRFYIEDVTIVAPEGSKNQALASLERLDVNVSLMPLLSKQLKVNSLTIVKPNIALEAFENGKLNIMTPKLEAMTSADAVAEATQPATGAQQVSLDQIRIKDGSFSYYDHKSKSETKVQNINMDLSAQSLQGPFDAEGSVFYNGNALNFDIETDAYNASEQVISPKIKLLVQPGNIGLEYQGVIATGEEFSIQGQTGIHIEDLKSTLNDFGVGVAGIKGGVLDAKGILTADKGALSFKNASLTLNGQPAKGAFEMAFSPFTYKLNIKTPDQISAAALLDGGYTFDKALLDINLENNGKELSFDKTSVSLDGHKFDVSGTYGTNAKTNRGQVDISLSASKIDYDVIATKLPKSSSGSGDMKSSIASLAMPVDLALDAKIGELVWQKKSLKNISVKAKTSENTAALNALSVKDFGGSSVNVSGDIQNLKNVSGITASVDIDSPDVNKLADALQLDRSSWPSNLSKAKVNVKATGSYDAMAITADVNAMGGQVIASGDVKTPLTAPAPSNLSIQLKHKNMAEAIQMFSGAKIADRNLQKPMDFKTKINQSGNKYSLKEITGDLSGISVKGDIEADLGGKVPDIKGNLAFGNVKMESVMTEGGSASQGAARWSKDPIDTAALHSVNVNLKLSANKITYGAWPLEKPTMSLSLHNGTLDISELTSNVFGGSIDMTARVKSSKEARAPVYFENTSEFKSVDLGKLTKALMGTQLVKISGDGNLNLNMKSSGASPAALIYDLSGSGVVNGTNIVLDGVDVERFVNALSYDTKPGDTVMGIWKGTTKGGQTKFDTLNGAFTIKNGVVALNSMDLDGARTQITTKGTIDLPKWYLSTLHNMSVKADENVASDVPKSFEIRVQGSLDNPAQEFTQNIMQQYLENKLKRKVNKLLSDKFGFPSNDNQQGNQGAGQNNQQQNQQQPKNLEDAAGQALEGVLKGLLR